MSYTETTNSIKISVDPAAIPEESSPLLGKYAFSYTVTIENLGEAAVKLLERHWVVRSGGEHFVEVVGEGVVGQLPELACGGQYSYTSGTIINKPVGEMTGSYTFRAETGSYFQVKIPTFDLLYPTVIN